MLWLIGAVVLLTIAEFEPSVLAYLLDPELLAATVVVAALLMRRAFQVVGKAALRIVDGLFWYQIRWPEVAGQYARTQGLATSILRA